MMSLKSLVSELQKVALFPDPKWALEQYKTGPQLAAEIVLAIQSAYEDIAQQVVVDLGCGTGILGIGAALLGANHVFGIDIDGAALSAAAASADDIGVSESISFVQCDVLSDGGVPLRQLSPKDGIADVAILNPPFGTRRPGADVRFLSVACALVGAEGRVYSLHKSSTRQFLVNKAASWGIGCELVAELHFDIPSTYAFHSHESLDVEVDLLRFVKGKGAPAVMARHGSIPTARTSRVSGGGSGVRRRGGGR